MSLFTHPRKLIAFGLLSLLTAAAVFWLSSVAKTKQTAPAAQTGQLQIYTSFYPLAYFASEIAGELAVVTDLSQAGGDPHHFEPSVRELRAIADSDLLIINGLGLEGFVDKFAANLPQEKILVASQDLTHQQLIELGGEEHEEEHHEEDEHHDEEEDGHDHGGTDPHVWLDPQLAIVQVQTIAAKLQELDPEHAAIYQTNATALSKQLQALDQEFSTGLASCRQQHVITAHQVLAYLATRYQFHQIGIQGISHEEEASPSKLAELSQLATELGVKYIFLENNLSPNLATALARETGASTLNFHTLELITSDERVARENYLSLQRHNLAQLRRALDCQ